MTCNTQNCPVDGKLSSWTDYGVCSKPCGPGMQERTRTCTPPRYGGKPCSGALSQSKSCEVKKCPIDGKLSAWSPYGACSAACGYGTKSRSRTCTPPQHGGKACGTPLTQSVSCRDKMCPVDCVWNKWGSYGPCSKTCGPGRKTRKRTVKTQKKYGGKDCNGAAEASTTCETKKCPVDGTVSAWAAWSRCNKECGPGSQYRSRACFPPKYGGKACPTPLVQNQACELKKCPINGGWSSYGSYGSCSKKCGTGTQTKTRTCTNPKPKYNGRQCSGSSSYNRNCNTHRCATTSDVKSFVEGKIRSYKGVANDVMAQKIQSGLNSRYSNNYFGTMVYDPVTGSDKHYIIGYASSHVTILRYNGYNVVVGWVSKSNSISKSSASSALSSVTDKSGCKAETDARNAWNKCSNCVMAMVVRHGNGLRANKNSQSVNFDNYRCERTCNWLNQCTDHKSSLVVVYGSN